eukprot:SAG31_NODE_1660_length_7599_cov_3.194800_4_plen_56_part_00
MAAPRGVTAVDKIKIIHVDDFVLLVRIGCVVLNLNLNLVCRQPRNILWHLGTNLI